MKNSVNRLVDKLRKFGTVWRVIFVTSEFRRCSLGKILNSISSNSLMRVLCLNVCRLCVPNIMSLGVCFIKKWHLVKVGAIAWYSFKIRVIFSVQFERRTVDKKQTYMKTETCKLYSRVFSVPNVIKIDPYNFELYRFKVCAFFLRQCSTPRIDCALFRYFV